MSLQEINQKLDQLLEYQKEQTKYNKIRFWINFVIILLFVILPLLLLPIVISKFIGVYTGSFDPDNLQNSTENANALLDLLR